jgi:hypothetical protein
MYSSQGDDLISQMSVTSERADITAEEIVTEANEIWRRVKKIPRTATYETVQEFLSQVRKTHKQLYQSYPLVMRHMIEERRYSPKVFARFLKQISEKPWGNDSERFEAYTDYAVMLFRATANHYDTKQLAEYRREYRRRLQAEHDDFITKTKEYEKLEDEKQKSRKSEVAKKIIELFHETAQKHGMSADNRAIIDNMIASGDISADMLEILTSEMARRRLVHEMNDQRLVAETGAEIAQNGEDYIIVPSE